MLMRNNGAGHLSNELDRSKFGLLSQANQLANRTTNRELRRQEKQARKRFPTLQPVMRQSQKVLISGNNHPSELERHVHMQHIRCAKQTQVFDGHDVDPLRAQARHNARIDAFVCVEPDAHRLKKSLAQLGVTALKTVHQLVGLRPLAVYFRPMRIVVSKRGAHLRGCQVRVRFEDLAHRHSHALCLPCDLAYLDIRASNHGTCLAGVDKVEGDGGVHAPEDSTDRVQLAARPWHHNVAKRAADVNLTLYENSAAKQLSRLSLLRHPSVVLQTLGRRQASRVHRGGDSVQQLWTAPLKNEHSAPQPKSLPGFRPGGLLTLLIAPRSRFGARGTGAYAPVPN